MADKLVDPHGEALARTEAEGLGAIETRVRDAIPTTIHGFTIEKKVGPYPAEAPRSHRRAVYVILRPVSDGARAICKRAGEEVVLAVTPLTPEGAAIVAAEPNGRLTERIVRDTLAAAWREVRKYARPV